MSKTNNAISKIKSAIGIDKQSKYVKNYFYATNMKSCIYMSCIIIVLEIWMIIRLTYTIYKNNLTADLGLYFEKYYSNYFLLLGAGAVMLVFAMRFTKGKKDSKLIGIALKWIFSAICLYFGIKISIADYRKGEQILTFLSMESVTVCLLVWRPITGFFILSASYGIFYYNIMNVIPTNEAYNALITGSDPVSAPTVATQINLFIMWINMLILCTNNYHKIKTQALKDESLEQVNAHLSRISVEDELTGIHNMVFFRSEAEKILSYVTTDMDSIIYLFFDIVNFKSYNEKYGFHQGNDLLKKVAKLIDKKFMGSLVSRFSDDHFVVLTNENSAIQIINQLSEEIKEFQGEVHLELKCGAYKPAGNERDPILACDRARFACNSIKKHYNTTFKLYDKSLEDKFQMKQYIMNNIDNAIANGHIKVFYQPVVSTQNGFVCGLEALARWQDPQYGLLPPGAFIEILEEYRQIHKLDQCIIHQVCRDYRKAKDNNKPFVPVSVNLSRLDFELCDIAEYVKQMAEKYEVPKNFIDIEVTESALIDQQTFLQKAMKDFHDAGFNIWLDDFGSGYSSFNVLKDYQFEVLKIDMKFLAGFQSNSKTRPILENVVNLTKQLNMLSLTEGVETQEQFEFLKFIGCNMVQGYLFSKPLPKEQLDEKIIKGELVIAPQYLR